MCFDVFLRVLCVLMCFDEMMDERNFNLNNYITKKLNCQLKMSALKKQKIIKHCFLTFFVSLPLEELVQQVLGLSRNKKS
jgi:hypothetical protein